jgi:hypothetical protein
VKTGHRTHASASLRISYTTLVPSNLRGRLREVSHFESTEPGQGHGTALMSQVCAEADGARVVLILMPTSDRLTYFYARHGFKPIQAEPALMMRVPLHSLAHKFTGATEGAKSAPEGLH